MPNRNRRAERREATRQEILTAAWEVAGEQGLAGLTLREIAMRVGMQPPSLYSHFDSKNAVYDAMFAQAWQRFGERIDAVEGDLPEQPRELLLFCATTYFDFAVEDVARALLMNVRVLPDFTPSPESYGCALAVYQRMRAVFARLGICDDTDFDLYTALLAGLVQQQLANDPGGTRWRELLPRVTDMYADAVGVPPRRRGRKR